MTDETKDVSTQRLLGQLLEGQSARKADVGRLEEVIRLGFESIHRRIDPLVAIPLQIAAHESEDTRRFAAQDEKSDRQHAENLNSVVDIRHDIGALKTERDMRRGARAMAHALSAAIGAAVAAIATLLKLKGVS
jgi:hypothetical protein